MPLRNPARKFVDQFLSELNVPKSYVRVTSGPKNLFWATVRPYQYYILIDGRLFKDMPDVYHELTRFVHDYREEEVRPHYAVSKYISNCTSDTGGLGLRYDVGNLGIIIDKFEGSDVSSKTRTFIEKHSELLDSSVEELLEQGKKELKPSNFEELKEILQTAGISF